MITLDPNMTCDMPAGRELDALVAQACGGWMWMGRAGRKWMAPASELGEEDPDEPALGETREGRDSDTAEHPWWLDPEQTSRDCVIVPHYSTDIAAAWPLVKQFGMLVFPSGDAWFAEQDHGPHCGRTVMQATTAPHAICLLALDAVARDQA